MEQENWNICETFGEDRTKFNKLLLSFENLPERLSTKDFAVVWQIWTSKGIECVIWRTK